MRLLNCLAVVCAALSFCWAPLPVQAEVVLSPKFGHEIAVDRGELLLGELSCINCHAADRGTTARLGQRKGPLLGEAGLRLTPQFLRKWLANPLEAKPGTTMPDLLHDLPETEKAETVDALVHYLVSLQKEPETATPGAEDYQIRQGAELFHSVGCVACHAPQQAPVKGSESAEVDFRELQGESIPLGDLARKTTADELARFLLDPMKVRPSGRMPSLGLTQAEATSIAMYLLREQLHNPADQGRDAALPGLKYQYYEDHLSGSPDFDKLTPKSSGTIATFDLAPRQREQSFGLRFSGTITVPETGAYTFFTTSDDGTQLFINGKLVVNNNGDHAPQERSGSVELPAGKHGIMLTFFNNSLGHEMKVEWRGPGFERQVIPANVLSHIGKPMVPLGTVEFAVDSVKTARGRELFGSLGCVSCHSISGGTNTKPIPARALAELNLDSTSGCLAPEPARHAAKYDLSQAQVQAIKAALLNQDQMRKRQTPAEQVTATMARLNCYACHSRDGQGAPSSTRLAYFHVTGEVDLGDEGRIPPHLTGVGAKLRPEWMREVLANKGWVRPYMATRMPQFGQANANQLVRAFARADEPESELRAPETGLLDGKFGRKLAGSGGLSCIACHNFGEHPSLGIPAVDLTTMTKRLNYDWFHRYLLDPPSLRPGTRMPAFWPEGEAVNQDILDGDTDAQIRALWAYLKAGPEADLPDGLVHGQREIVAEDEPVIYRNFIEGAGTRAIGVGYPEKVNLAFDANDLRLALIWHGSFIDGARHSSGRGAGFEPPLGHNVRGMPEGAPFAILAGATAPWPKEAGKAAGYRMLGYQLDESRRPAFRYRFQEITVEDRFLPQPGELDSFFRRELEFSGSQSTSGLYYRAAVGSRIEKNDQGYLVDGQTILRFSGDAMGTPLIRESDSRQELLVPIQLEGGQATLVEEIIW